MKHLYGSSVLDSFCGRRAHPYFTPTLDIWSLGTLR